LAVKRFLMRKLKLHLGPLYDPEARRPPLPRPPKRKGRPPHIISCCKHCPRRFDTAEKKRDHQRYCLRK
jgi:hypothetical protein